MIIISWKRLCFISIIVMMAAVHCSIFDIFPPTINIVDPKDKSIVSYRTTIIGSVEERNLDRIEIFVNNGKVLEQSENEINYTIFFLSPDTYYLRVKAYDKAGNWSEVIWEVYSIFQPER